MGWIVGLTELSFYLQGSKLYRAKEHEHDWATTKPEPSGHDVRLAFFWTPKLLRVSGFSMSCTYNQQVTWKWTWRACLPKHSAEGAVKRYLRSYRQTYAPAFLMTTC